MCGLNLIMALDNVHFSLLKHRLEWGTEGILWLTHQSLWHFVQVMDILISLLYTGAQDGWMTINGWARLFPWKQWKDEQRLRWIHFPCFKDYSTHLGHGILVSVFRQRTHVAKVLLTQQLSSLHRDNCLLSTGTHNKFYYQLSGSLFDTFTSPHFHNLLLSILCHCYQIHIYYPIKKWIKCILLKQPPPLAALPRQSSYCFFSFTLQAKTQI